MPKPRVTVTLDQDNLDTLKRLSAHSGGSVSGLLNDLVTAVEPSLHKAADLFDAAQSVSGQALDDLRSSADHLDASLRPQLQQALRLYQSAMAQIQSVVDQANGQHEPPCSNTGGQDSSPAPDPRPGDRS